ncbi:zinc metallopeptidase [Enterocloster lavalensis]|uniref:zinc metallopeptidase n=1 Tax=Enterocloster lavalensis TaxID=460384 RepID=UPI001D064F8B|nr:zinc metallopeptidase [Enterocloster lavalensis]MCB6343978.1 zinc metallopeptidase [Enterocloster lavalensis]
MMYPMFYFDPSYVLILIGLLLSMAASAKVNSTYARYARVGARCGMTGAEAAKRLLNSQGIYDVTVRRVPGKLTDHYDPRNKTVNLSESVYGSTSIAAIGVAAHECGHAMQDAGGYVPLRVRGALVPVANFGAQISWPLILIGILFSSGSSSMLITLGILMFSLSVLFQLVTLPVEFNASSRAVSLLDRTGILAGQEVGQTRQVLSAAALTYVAAAAASILQLLRLLYLFGGNRRRD